MAPLLDDGFIGLSLNEEAKQDRGPNGSNVSNGTSEVEMEPPFSTMNGAPVQKPAASQRIGNQLRATLLLQDINLLELIQHITHERIPERVVHARGTSAHGYFEVTDQISDLTSAKFLSTLNKQTPLFCRLSTVAGRADSAETVRDTRGFAFKMYTEEGNLDWLFLSTPVFPIRDGAKFPSFTHATKKNPGSGLPDHKAFWDYFTHNQEAIHFLMFLFSNRALPIDYQHADIFGINTYRFTKPGQPGPFKYIKMHLKPKQGTQYFTAGEAELLAGVDPDFHTRRLYDDIAKGNFPQWDVHAQVIDPMVAARSGIDIFDPTKTLPQADFPLRRFGKIVLNKNVDNFFAEQEQAAFSPTNIVPGWALSPDPILQTRALAYANTQRYRLGANFIQTPVNKPHNRPFNPLIRDGTCNVDGNLGSTPNYYPSSFYNLSPTPQYAEPDQEQFAGTVTDYESPIVLGDYAQATVFWQDVLPKEPGIDGQQTFVDNVSGHLRAVTGDKSDEIKKAVYEMFAKVSPDLGKRIKAATEGPAPKSALEDGSAASLAKKLQALNPVQASSNSKDNSEGAKQKGAFNVKGVAAAPNAAMFGLAV